MYSLTKLGIVSLTAISLSACTTQSVQDNQNTLAGAGLGGAFGAILGRTVAKDKKRGTQLGAVLGGAIGASLGAQLDAQERALKSSIGGSGAMITNTGEQLIVTLPEAITFDFDSSVVKSRFIGPLNQLAANLNDFPNSRIQVVGHTDDRGTVQYNNDLSTARARAVANVLVRGGVAASRINTFGEGEFNPVASNSTPDGRRANRRVVITITPIV